MSESGTGAVGMGGDRVCWCCAGSGTCGDTAGMGPRQQSPQFVAVVVSETGRFSGETHRFGRRGGKIGAHLASPNTPGHPRDPRTHSPRAEPPLSRYPGRAAAPRSRRGLGRLWVLVPLSVPRAPAGGLGPPGAAEPRWGPGGHGTLSPPCSHLARDKPASVHPAVGAPSWPPPPASPVVGPWGVPLPPTSHPHNHGSFMPPTCGRAGAAGEQLGQAGDRRSPPGMAEQMPLDEHKARPSPRPGPHQVTPAWIWPRTKHRERGRSVARDDAPASPQKAPSRRRLRSPSALTSGTANERHGG